MQSHRVESEGGLLGRRNSKQRVVNRHTYTSLKDDTNISEDEEDED
jgi:hypothetical protein